MDIKKRLIEASALHEELVYNTTRTGIGGCDCITVWRVADAIANAPTVDAVEVVHGRWIEQIKDERFGEEWDEIALYECSVCKSEFVEGMGAWRYCPNCGAKMDGGYADGSV